MRKLLSLVALSAALLVAAPAQAGENKHLGVITVAGASLTNQTTAVPFAIPPGAKLTLVCSAAVQYLADATVVTTGTTGSKGYPIAASTGFPTSVGGAQVRIGGKDSGLIAIIGTGFCDVWARQGTE